MIHIRQKLDTSERRTWLKQYGPYGYRKIARLLGLEGWVANYKKVERFTALDQAQTAINT
ncbi:MAG: hypothetical protein AAGH90_04490 [Pseudomonadota bacterium]